MLPSLEEEEEQQVRLGVEQYAVLVAFLHLREYPTNRKFAKRAVGGTSGYVLGGRLRSMGIVEALQVL